MKSTKHPPQTTIVNGIDVTKIPADKVRPLTARQIVAAAQRDLDSKKTAKKSVRRPKKQPKEPTEEIPEELEV